MVLDEPTNHLDLWARDGLETALCEFTGTVLFVTHDRYFIDQVATHVLVIEEDRCRIHDGNYSQYLGFRENNDVPGNEPVVPPPKNNPGPENDSPTGKAETVRPKRQFPYRKVAEIEADILEAESRKDDLEELLADPEIHRDTDRMQQTITDYEIVQDELDMLVAHWEEAIELN